VDYTDRHRLDGRLIDRLSGNQIRNDTQSSESQYGVQKITPEALVSLLEEGRREGFFAVNTELIHNTLF
jgi:hypothetical protein